MAKIAHRPSAEQEDIIRAGRGAGNFDIVAGAGCAKTTTLQFLAQDQMTVPTIYHAFNSSVVTDSVNAGKFSGTRTVPSTMHSTAFRAVKAARPDMSLIVMNTKTIMADENFQKMPLPRINGVSEYKIAAITSNAMRAFCNSADKEASTDHATIALIDALGNPDLIANVAVAERNAQIIDDLAPVVAAIVRDIYRDCVESGRVTHDIYLKMFESDPAMIRSGYRGIRRIMLDEAQDTSPVQMSILRQAERQLIRVGDPKQAIYGWRGAIDALASDNGAVLPLTSSYRFPQDIADIAMEAAGHSPAGGLGFPLVGVGNGRVVPKGNLMYGCICRTNTGVLATATKLAERGTPFTIDKADEVVRELESAISMFEGGRKPGVGPLAPFSDWSEVVREAEEGSDGDIRRIVRIVEDGLAEKAARVIRESALGEKGSRRHHVITAHRSKGDEYPSVTVGLGWDNVHEMKTKYHEAKSESGRIAVAQEFNLLYVLATRAQVKIGGMGKILSPEEDPAPQMNG